MQTALQKGTGLHSHQVGRRSPISAWLADIWQWCSRHPVPCQGRHALNLHNVELSFPSFSCVCRNALGFTFPVNITSGDGNQVLYTPSIPSSTELSRSLETFLLSAYWVSSCAWCWYKCEQKLSLVSGHFCFVSSFCFLLLDLIILKFRG